MFPFITILPNLEKFGIYREVKESNYKMNSLLLALKYLGFNTNEMNLYCKKGYISKNSIIKVAEIINKQFNIFDLEKNKWIKINRKGEEILRFGKYKSHYFVIEKTEYTNYALNNYERLHNIPNFNSLINDKKRDREKCISSLNLMRFLLKHKDRFLKPITRADGEILQTVYQRQIKDLPQNLPKITKSDYKPISYKPNRQMFKGENYLTYFFDYESDTVSNPDKHIPYMVNLYNGIEHKTFFGSDCTKKMFTWLSFNTADNNILLIAHNLRYDFSFIQNNENVRIKNIIKTGNMLKTCSLKYFKKNIVLKDSYAMISKPLRDFGKCFNLQIEKEVFPYNLYTQENLKKDVVLISKALEHISTEDHESFLDNLERLKIKRGNYFNHHYYSKYYCRLDCEVLYQGYMRFRNNFQIFTGFDIKNFVSIPHISNMFFKKKGVFTECYDITGIPREFIQKCIVGGRCMTRDNQKFHITEELADFDAKSLYPSAMNRMDGFLKGTPKVITDKMIVFSNLLLKQNKNISDTISSFIPEFSITNQDGYFVEIEIIDSHKELHFPIITKMINNKRMFQNTLRGRGFYVDKYALEDLIKFQCIEFKFIRGYYFNQGRNTKIKDVIKFMYDERKKLKSQGNPVQEIIKLLMNAGYGKLIQNPIETNTKFFYSVESLMQYVNNHPLVEFKKIDHRFILKHSNEINIHFNATHLGSEVLSMSKRIMNEVMCLAEDLNLSIYYQDTDSMHIINNQVPILEKEFEKKYKRVLIGPDMGQFHSDFEGKTDRGTEIVAVESYFLGKKCYLDKLRLIQQNKPVFEYHIRMKGIPNKAILEQGDPLEIYEKLYNGETVEFDLLKNSVRFEYTDSWDVKNRLDFKRKIKFE
jgi:hypothetical protein